MILTGLLAAAILVLGSVVVMRMPHYQWLAAAIVITTVTIVTLSGFWFSTGQLGISDWDYYFSYHENLRRTILDHHQFPLWNPYTCGGTAALGDPEFPVFTPTFLLELAFGIPAGFRLAIYLATLTGAWGMLALSKRLHLTPLAGLLAATVYALGSVNLLEIVEGHPNVFAAGWIPWIFWAWLTGYRSMTKQPWSWRSLLHPWALACALFLALTFFQGGIYLLMYTALAFLVLPWLTRHPMVALRFTIIAGVWGLGFAAIKLVPTMAWLAQFQDTAYASSTFTLPYLHHIFFGRYLHGADILPNQGSGWHEYGAYVGITTFVLALIGSVLTWRQRLTRGLLIAAVLATLVSSLGPILKPLFDVAPFLPRSNISRLILFAVLPLALLAGQGLTSLKQRWPKTSTYALPLILGAAGLEILSLATLLSYQAFVLPPVVPTPSPAPSPIAFTALTYKYRHEGDDYTRAYAATKAGYGSLSYCSVLSPAPAVRTIHDEDHRYVSVSNDAATAELTAWQPNEVRVTVITPIATDVTINTNYAAGWWVNGEPTREMSGLVGTHLTAGQHELVFSYHPIGLTAGLLGTMGAMALALAGSFVIFRKK